MKPALSLLLALAACATPTDSDGPAGPAGPPPGPVAACTYDNPFSRAPECREYLGVYWTEARATRDCVEVIAGTLELGGRCRGDGTGGTGGTDAGLGTCTIAAGTPREHVLYFPGSDPADCEATQRGCEVFAGGTFSPSSVCDGATPPPGGGGPVVFVPPELSCVPPRAGEPPGASPGGDVCTYSMISACTEEGRRYADYGACDAVRTQRPYYPASPADHAPVGPDPRLDDAALMGELAWVKSQVEACACVCCHSSELAPSGASNWFIEAEPYWVDTFSDYGLAFAAGWVDSTTFGAYPPEDNNGFDRSVVGLPTTDVARMRAFFEGELARRGLGPDDFVDAPPAGGPLYDQLVYTPSACSDGVGVLADGTIEWAGGGARYVYVLEPDANNPHVPPNLNLPDGTIWRIDVPPTGTPLEPGIRYGVVTAGTRQRFPDAGAPAPLVAGRTYYLYVLADVAIPITRCLFVAR